MTVGTLLCLFILGVLIFKVASEYILLIEASLHNPYAGHSVTSEQYHFLVLIASSGLALAVASLLELFVRMEKLLRKRKV